jgi:hypothetical protein
MQTRRKARQQDSADAAALLPHLPLAVQTHILDMLVARYPEPDPEEYVVLRPHRSSLGWLLSLRRVCSAWDHHLQQQNTLARRVRLEKLRNLSLLHFFAYYIMSDKSKQQRIKQVPRSICLRFSDHSSTDLDIPRGGIAGLAKQYGQQQTEGLPTHALVLVADSHGISSAALLELLTDMDTLDKRHTAPILLQIRRPYIDHGDSSSSGCSRRRSSAQKRQNVTVSLDVSSPSGTGVVDPAVASSSNSSFAALDAAVLLALSAIGPLRNIAQEGDASCAAMTFIPTKNSFCRRMPAP